MNGPEVAVSAPCSLWEQAIPDVEDLCRRVVAVSLGVSAQALEDVPAERLEVSVVLADDATVRELNARYRGQDKPTNVLSFAALDDEEAPLPEDGPVLLGDVIVAYETTAAEAAGEGKTLGNHLSHLLVHGVLHLFGYDHLEEDEAEEMEGLERSILGALGVPDPYAVSAGEDAGGAGQ